MSGTHAVKKSIYESDELPNREDKKRAKGMFYDEETKEYDLEAMGDEVVMQRRYSVSHSRKIESMDKKLDGHINSMEDVKTIIMGKGELGLPSINDKMDQTNACLQALTSSQTKTDKKLAYYAGGIAVVVIFVPIILDKVFGS